MFRPELDCGDNPAHQKYARPFEAAECAPLFRPTLADPFSVRSHHEMAYAAK
jgi:hypothetical protein